MANRSRGRKSARSRSVSASASNSPMRTGGDSLVAPIVSSLIAIAINAYLLDYILRLEKRDCECSDHWQRDYIKYFSIVIIVISVLMIILALSGVRVRGPLAGLLQFVRMVVGFASLFNVFVLYNYSTGLNRKDCDCSANTARTFMQYYSTILIGLIILAVFVGIIMSSVRAARM